MFYVQRFLLYFTLFFLLTLYCVVVFSSIEAHAQSNVPCPQQGVWPAGCIPPSSSLPCPEQGVWPPGCIPQPPTSHPPTQPVPCPEQGVWPPECTPQPQPPPTTSSESLNPIIIIPGLAGTRLVNNSGEVWLNPRRFIEDAIRNVGFPTNEHLDVLRLQPNGVTPLFPDNPNYTSVRTGAVITNVGETVNIPDQIPGLPDSISFEIEFYQPLINYFESDEYELGRNLFLFPYDWRRNIIETSAQLDVLVNQVQQANEYRPVEIIGHSMGGLVGRQYILNPQYAMKVNSLALLGSPLLGSPSAFEGIYLGDDFGINERLHQGGVPSFLSLINEEKIKELASNWPGIYQLMPSERFFDVYENGYIVEGGDIDGDGNLLGEIGTYEQNQAVLDNLLNQQLVGRAERLHSTQFDGFDQGSNSVNVCVFVGVGFPTEAQLRFWDSGGEIQYGWAFSDGDGTVNTHSADLNHGGSNFQGDAHVYYARETHQGLTQSSNVLQQVSSCLVGQYGVVNGAISTRSTQWAWSYSRFSDRMK